MVYTVESLVQRSGIKCVVYGGSGIGKTRLSLTAPRPVYISAEKGMLSLIGSGIPVWGEVRTLAELMKAHEWLLNSKEAQAYDTVILDSVSELADNVLQMAKANTKDGRKAHNDTYELLVFNVLNSWRDLPNKHVYMVAKERYDEDKLTQVKQFKPSMPNGNLVRELPYKFDFVFRMFQHFDMQSGQTSTWLQCQADTQAVAKDRSGQLQKYEPPNLGAIFTKAMQQR